MKKSQNMTRTVCGIKNQKINDIRRPEVKTTLKTLTFINVFFYHIASF